MGTVLLQKGKTTSQQEDTHEREGDQTESAATNRIDQEQRRDGEDHLNGTISERGVESLVVGVTGIPEDRGGVEGDDVDTAHLLGKHSSGGGVVGTPDTGNREAVPKTAEVSSTTGGDKLLLVDDIGVVVVTGRDNGVSAKTVHGAETLGNLSVLHQPTRRLGAEEDADGEEQGGDEGRAELKTPSDLGNVLDDNVGAEAQEDTGDDPELPEHDKGTTDTGGSHLGGEDGDSSVLGTDTDTHDKTSGEELLPGPGETGTNGGGSQAKTSDEDLTTTTEVVVEGIDDEGTNETGSQENDGVDDTNDPFTLATHLVQTELLREGQVGTVGTSLIPTLSSGTDGANTNGVPEGLGAVPLVAVLVVEGGNLILEETFDPAVLAKLITGNQSSATEEVSVLGQVVLLSEDLGINDVLLLAEALGIVLVFVFIDARAQVKLTVRGFSMMLAATDWRRAGTLSW